jgi:glucose-1-phosphate thymidylyltransferase
MKGIVLAGGTGSRLAPLTSHVSKQLLPVYNKPMIFYPLSVLMLAKIQEILIITTPHDQPLFQKLLQDGSRWNLKFTYATQDKSNGIADALRIAESYLNGSDSCLILGDNIIYKDGLQNMLLESKQWIREHRGAVVFSHSVIDPERYGVAVLDDSGELVNILEKPKTPPSNQAIIGLYFFDSDAPRRARGLAPSDRGELEITDLNLSYLKDEKLKLRKLGRGTAWFDMGTHESLLESANFVSVIEKRQGLKIADLDELRDSIQF